MLERQLFDELFPKDAIIKESDQISTHIHDYRIVNGYHTCILCGEVNIHRMVYYESLNRSVKSYYLYHRKSYFKEKLRLLTGRKQSLSNNYINIDQKCTNFTHLVIYVN